MTRSSWAGSHNKHARKVNRMNGRRIWTKTKRTDKKDRQWNKKLSRGEVEA